jgi:hypothetical protein
VDAAKKEGTDTQSKAETASKEAAADKATLDNQKARATWVSQQKANWQHDFDNKTNIAKSVFEVATSLAKVGGAVGEYFSGMKQAEGKQFEALSSYTQALMQAELDFANQSRDSIKAILDTLKSVEQAKHQATQGIYNI